MYVNEINNKLENILKDNTQVDYFIEKLSELTEIIFFGGAIRDLYFDNINEKPRDLDIVLTSKRNFEQVEFLIKQFSHRKNRFGGYKLAINGLELDIWYLENTWAFQNKKLKMSEENLTRSVYLSVDGVSYNYNRRMLNDNIFSNTNKKRIIDIVLEDNPQEELNLVRALIFKKKYKYELSRELVQKYIEYSFKENTFVKNLYKIQIDHYREEKLTYKQIEEEVRLITNSNKI